MSLTQWMRRIWPMQRRHLALLGQLASTQHRLLDQSTSLGYLWSFLSPLLLLLVLWTVFSGYMGAEVPHYALYLLIGLVHFTHFSKSTASAMRVIYRMRGLATAIIFPKDLLVYGALFADIPEFLISMALVVIIAVASGIAPSWAWLLLPVVLFVQILLVAWIGLLLSIFYVFVRDLDHIFEVVMRLLFFATPIFYTSDILSPTLQTIASANPLAHVIGFSRTILLEGYLPPLGHLGGFVMLNLVLVGAAIAIFRRAEAPVLERL